jgi:hypothetical protein
MTKGLNQLQKQILKVSIILMAGQSYSKNDRKIFLTHFVNTYQDMFSSKDFTIRSK